MVKVICTATQISPSSKHILFNIVANGISTNRPRLVRLVSPINASIHDLFLIDSPKFHFVLDFAINVEVYHLTIRGGNLGSYDGIDAIGTNYYIHDNEVGYSDVCRNAMLIIQVTNRDECVSIKSPSNHALVENLVCNQAGSGISIGSLNVSAAISNIVGSPQLCLKRTTSHLHLIDVCSTPVIFPLFRETMLRSSKPTLAAQGSLPTSPLRISEAKLHCTVWM